MNDERLVSVLIHNFGLAASLTNRDNLLRFPLALAETERSDSLLIDANQLALKDISLGMTAAQGKARSEGLVVLARDHKKESALAQEILARLQQVSPTVETDHAGSFYIDTPGLVRLYKSERGIARQIRTVLRSLNLQVGIGIAGNKLTAHTASLLDNDGVAVLVPAGTERTFLAPLPISILPLTVDTKEKLYLLGLTKVKDIARLPSHEITRRFGYDLLALADYVNGKDRTPYLPVTPHAPHTLSTRVDFPIRSREQLATYLKDILERMLAPLKRGNSGCREAHVTLGSAGTSPTIIKAVSQIVTASVTLWLRQLTTELEKRKELKEIYEITVTLHQVDHLVSEQLSLEGSGVIDTVGLPEGSLPLQSILIHPARIPERSYSFSDEHRKANNTFSLARDYTRFPVSGLRLNRIPRETRIRIDNQQISQMGSEPVLRQFGPWIVTGHWWEGEYRRWYYDIVTTAGARYLIYYDSLQTKWYRQAVFD